MSQAFFFFFFFNKSEDYLNALHYTCINFVKKKSIYQSCREVANTADGPVEFDAAAFTNGRLLADRIITV